MNPLIFLFQLYLPICTAVSVGAGISYFLGLPIFKRRFKRQLNRDIPTYLGKFLFLIGVPLSIINFLRRADLSGSVLVAPLVAWSAICLKNYSSVISESMMLLLNAPGRRVGAAKRKLVTKTNLNLK